MLGLERVGLARQGADPPSPSVIPDGRRPIRNPGQTLIGRIEHLLRVRRQKEIFVQVPPRRIGSLNQRQFPCPLPTLDPLLAQDRGIHLEMLLPSDQSSAAVFLRKPSKIPFAVFEAAPQQVAGDAKIERAVRLASHQVNRDEIVPRHTSNQSQRGQPSNANRSCSCPGFRVSLRSPGMTEECAESQPRKPIATTYTSELSARLAGGLACFTVVKCCFSRVSGIGGRVGRG